MHYSVLEFTVQRTYLYRSVLYRTFICSSVYFIRHFNFLLYTVKYNVLYCGVLYNAVIHVTFKCTVHQYTVYTVLYITAKFHFP